MLQKMKSWGGVAFAALAAVAMSMVPADDAKAQFASDVVTTIESSQADMILIGVAVVAVLVLIAAIGWTARAFRK